MEKVGKNPTRIAKHPTYAIFVLERETRELPARGEKKKNACRIRDIFKTREFSLAGI